MGAACAVVAVGIGGLFWSIYLLCGVLTASTVTLATWGLWASAVLIVLGLTVFVAGLVRVSRVRQHEAPMLVAAAAARRVCPGEAFGRMKVIQCGDEVVLSSAHDAMGNGLVRLGAALASAGAGAALCYGQWTGVISFGPKGWIGGPLMVFMVPAGLATGFNVSWAASMSAADGEPGMLFERRYLFFVRKYDTVAAHDILAIDVEYTHTNSQLRLIGAEGQCDILATEKLDSKNVGRLYALRMAVFLAMGLSADPRP